MERDALIAHGTSYLLQDRLMNCSDYSTAWVCRTCGSLISLGFEDISLGEDAGHLSSGSGGEYCRICRVAEEERDARERAAFASGDQIEPSSRAHSSVRVALPSSNVLGSTKRGSDLDVVAVPYVFRYLCAELGAMGIAVSLEVR